MVRRTVVVASASGLHARPAALFSQAAAALGVPVTVTAAGRTVDAASIIGILTLGADRGQEVTVASASADAVAVLAAMLERDLDLE